ncbi:TIGR04282 family arsenosugar biosynthesis glycosyltransferase [Cyanobium sp. Morenito 9A2]|uniref:TIGR04282 family arsenosugar biosynthesis glycosyltransferase n=1 Tax=Cyanobium sp. Morenito 9A2 TaxID=2823718 RepID=UPI0020CE9D67|nr:TIGR04282 family arsenosugar biosynthesis glycosyltransferase [Cyanobium sp. Morenito 9A2]MCP9849261.1 TIGR04282 family arsenosugar biosynthesis glycosyltransferase [Cyanobium sp. Morenito 9A2]
MSRWPAPGRCKRRLAAGIGAVAAARIQARLTQHTLAVAQEVTRPVNAELVLAVEGLGPRAAARWGRELGADRVRLQGPGGLGLRLQRQLRHSFLEGAQAVALIGTDLPRLDRTALATALVALTEHPLVLGPAIDGGYWLLGLGAGQPSAPLLVGIPWGTEQVWALTCVAAAALGLTPLALGSQQDLDRLEDLAPWLR